MAAPNNSYEMAKISAEAHPTPPNLRAQKISHHLENPHESHTTMFKTTVHWKAPLLMAGSFMLGVAIAVAHHLFYTTLDGQVVQGQTEQQWYGRIGTGLAFLVKTLLVMAVSVACVQNIWRILKSKPMRLGGVDSMFDVLSNARSLSSLRLWLDGPAVVALAIIAWLIPLAAVVAPPTLTVHIAPKLGEHNQTVKIPSLDFTRPNYGLTYSPNTQWARPQIGITRMAYAVATQGSRLNIAAPFSNSTYTLNFFGPALRCGNADETVNRDISQPLAEFSAGISSPLSRSWISYIAFVPMGSMATNSTIGDTVNATLQATDRVHSIRTLDMASGDMASGDMARLYIGVIAGNNHGSHYTIHECGLYNSSYLVDFHFNNGIQLLEIRNVSYLHGVPACYNCSSSDPNVVGYQSVMDSVGQILEGYYIMNGHGSGTCIRT